MVLPTWAREPARRTQVIAWVLLAVSVAWGLFRIARSMQILFSVTHDGFMYYSLWFVMSHRDVADIALRQSLYLPHTWVFLTPIFVFGWPVAKVLLLLVNTGAVGFIWWRLSTLAELRGIKRWLLLAFFCSWLSTGLVLGLGNLALVCIAAAVASYPFASKTNGVFLALSAMKQSLVFPIYFQLLVRRPRVLVVPTIVFSLSGVAALWWAGLSVPDGFKMLKAWGDNVSSWTLYDHTCLRRILAFWIHNKLMLTIVLWGVWFALFGLSARLVRDPLAQLAALLLLGLLPIYHFQYDMVAAVPTLAVLMQRCRLIWPALMTLALATNLASPMKGVLGRAGMQGTAELLEASYYPGLILVLLGALLWLEVRRHRNGELAADYTAASAEAPADGAVPGA